MSDKTSRCVTSWKWTASGTNLLVFWFLLFLWSSLLLGSRFRWCCCFCFNGSLWRLCRLFFLDFLFCFHNSRRRFCFFLHLNRFWCKKEGLLYRQFDDVLIDLGFLPRMRIQCASRRGYCAYVIRDTKGLFTRVTPSPSPTNQVDSSHKNIV